MKAILTKKTAPYAFVAPVLLLFSVFTIYPFAKTFYLSFFTLRKGHYVGIGFGNFIRLFYDDVFWQALWNTFFYLIIQVPVMIAMALIIACILNSKFTKWKTQFRIGFFLPAVTEMVAYSIVFSILLSDQGLVNKCLTSLGFSEIHWLTSSTWSKISVIMAITWRWTGYNMVIMLAGLQSIPDSLYEAADIEGANKIQKFFYITVPQMKYIIIFTAILSTIGTLNLFSEPYILTMGGPNNSTLTLGLYLYQQGFASFDFGYASAISIVILILTALISFIQLKLGGKNDVSS